MSPEREDFSSSKIFFQKKLQQCHPTFCLKLKEMCELKAATLEVSNEVIDIKKKKVEKRKRFNN
jgi:hypothetical protein